MIDVITVSLFACNRPTQCSMAVTSYSPCILEYHITQVSPIKESPFSSYFGFLGQFIKEIFEDFLIKIFNVS